MNRIKELLDEYRYYILGVSIVLTLLTVVTAFVIFNNKGADDFDDRLKSQPTTALVDSTSSHQSLNAASISNGTTESSAELVVDIKGSIKKPGVYQLSPDSRMIDLIDVAAGFKSTADTKNVNLAQKLSDQQVIYIPAKGEIKENLHLDSANDQFDRNSSSQDLVSNSGNSNGKININNATKEELQTISGIGEKKAENIIRYRQENGSFKSVDDVKNTDGIGDKMFENIKNNITI